MRKRVEAGIAPDLEAGLEGDADLLQQFGAAQHDRLLELEVRNAVDEQPADPVVPVIDRHLIALAAEEIGRGEACRARRR